MTADHKLRAERLESIIDGYEVFEDGMPDPTVPGADKPRWSSPQGEPILNYHPRFVLVTQYGDKGNYRLRLGKDLRGIEQLAADAATDAEGGEQPICYFDLDRLAGEEPAVFEDDVVRYPDDDMGRHYRVQRVEEELIEGEVARYLCLLEQGRTAEFWDDWTHRVHEEEVGIVERVEPDERMPVRYLLAKVATIVAFNSTPEAP